MLFGLCSYFWYVPLRNRYTIKPRFCFHIAEFVMCRQPHQKSGYKQQRTSSGIAPFTENEPAGGTALPPGAAAPGRLQDPQLDTRG